MLNKTNYIEHDEREVMSKMNNNEREQLIDLKDDIQTILELDNNYLTKKMREDPEDIIVTLRAGFLLLYSILDESINS